MKPVGTLIFYKDWNIPVRAIHTKHEQDYIIPISHLPFMNGFKRDFLENLVLVNLGYHSVLSRTISYNLSHLLLKCNLAHA